MIHRMTVNDLREKLTRYTTPGTMGWLYSFVVTPTNPPAIQDLISLVNEAWADHQDGPLTEQQQLRFLQAYATLNAQPKLDRKTTEFIQSFKNNDTAFYLGIIESLYRASLLDDLSLRILNQSIVDKNNPNRVPVPSHYAFGSIYNFVNILLDRKGLTHATLRWVVLTACSINGIDNSTFHALLRVKPLSYFLATIIGSYPNPIQATRTYIEHVSLFDDFPEEASRSADPINAVVAIDVVKKAGLYTPPIQKVILEAANSIETANEIVKMKELEIEFDVSLLTKIKYPSGFVISLSRLRNIGISISENIDNFVAAAAKDNGDFERAITNLHDLKLLNTLTFNLLEKFDYSSKVVECLMLLPKRLITETFVKQLEKRDLNWLFYFHRSLCKLEQKSVTLTSDILTLLVATRVPANKAHNITELVSAGLWDDDTKKLVKESSAKHGETTAVTQAMCALKLAKLDGSTLFRDWSLPLHTAKMRREEAGLSDSEVEDSPKIARHK